MSLIFSLFYSDMTGKLTSPTADIAYLYLITYSIHYISPYVLGKEK